MAHEFKIGDRIRTLRPDDDFFPAHAVGEIVAASSAGHWYVAFDKHQGVKDNYVHHLNDSVRMVERLWIVAENSMEPEFSALAGEHGWVPDRLRHDIDVLQVTRELVSTQVGK